MHRDRSCRSFKTLRRAVAALSAAAALTLGCSGSPHAVDAPRAREALKLALDGWKKGDAPASFKDGSLHMTVQDLDWLGGARLLDYQVAGDGQEADANLLIPVTLSLRTPQGKDVKKSVSYVVGTSPQITVFRAFQ